METKSSNAHERATVAEAASALAEERLDTLNANYQKQIQMRQTCEVELEKTVAELSQQVALLAQTTTKPRVMEADRSQEVQQQADEYKEQY